MVAGPAAGAVLALDTSSPVVSVAVAAGDRVLAWRQGAQRESSARLLAWIEETLAEAGLPLAEVAGVVALAGPGSFTGLRVGLATALGLHQALGVAATTLPTLQVLAAAAAPHPRALCVVPALPGEWFAQPWSTGWPPVALGEPRRLRTAALPELLPEPDAPGAGPVLVAGPGVDTAAAAAACGVHGHGAGPLAPVAARLAARHPPDWDAARLTTPLYLAPAPVTPATAPKRVIPPAPRRRGPR
jgi:tRNA threonylcarbamoyl adenosine modification protein YeaZ